jgi:peptide/nickel transport system substrate-binding protein
VKRLIVLVAVCALLTGCGTWSGGGAAVSPSGIGGQDINPHPRDEVADGGTLRWPIDGLPNNYNYLQLDGTLKATLDIVSTVLPRLWTSTADGGFAMNTDYLTSARITSTNPQVVTYTFNPKAVWSDGTPITWRDIEASWRSQNGTNPAFQSSGTTGFEDVASVTRGVDDRQAVVTFRRTFAEWQSLFDPLYPASRTGTPDGFNTGYATGFPVTAGPFALESIDQTAKTVTVRRDPRWWGTPPKLDRIVFRQFEQAALPDALANNEIDFFDIGSSIDLLRRAQTTPGVAIRNAPSQYLQQVTLNGSPGALLADPALRRALAQGIDRAAVAQRMIGRIESNPATSGNRIYRKGSKQYRDNSDVLPYDPAAAERTLDGLGWARPAPGAPRQKAGRPLRLRLIYYNAGTNEQMVRTLQNQLARIGVTVVPEQYPSQEWQKNMTTGNFDLVIFSWGNTSTPLSSSVGIYGSPLADNVRQNYGRIAGPEIDALFAQAIGELDDAKRIEIGNRIDRLLWANQHDIPLFARPAAVAVRDDLANFGAAGFADADLINAGFVK